METYYGCKCGFKCVESQLAKTEGACPKCGARSGAMKEKYGAEKMEMTNIHKVSRGEM